MSFLSKRDKFLILRGRLTTAGADFKRGKSKHSKKIFYYEGGNGRISVPKVLAEKLDPEVDMAGIFIKGMDGEEILRELIAMGYFNKYYGLVFLNDHELNRLLEETERIVNGSETVIVQQQQQERKR